MGRGEYRHNSRIRACRPVALVQGPNHKRLGPFRKNLVTMGTPKKGPLVLGNRHFGACGFMILGALSGPPSTPYASLAENGVGMLRNSFSGLSGLELGFRVKDRSARRDGRVRGEA